MNLLICDTETSPNQVDTWGLRDQNIAINQIRKPGALLCFAAKWYGTPDDEVIFDSVNESTRKRMVRHLHALYSDADAVIGYNNIAFDTKVVNREFLLAGLDPPPPFKQIDLLRTMRGNFRFASNKLDFVSQQLALGAKQVHHGHGLWTECERGDQDAWALMKKYNIQDVLLTEKLYKRVLPWIKNHPNRTNYDQPGVPACPRCGGLRLQRRGYERTVANLYARFRCVACGAWTREAFTENTRLDRQGIMRNI